MPLFAHLAHDLAQLVEVHVGVEEAEHVATDRVHRAELRDEGRRAREVRGVGPGFEEGQAHPLAFGEACVDLLRRLQRFPGDFGPQAQVIREFRATRQGRSERGGFLRCGGQVRDDVPDRLGSFALALVF